MLRQLDNLNRRIVAYLRRETGGQRDLWQTKGAVVLLVRGPCDLEDGQHGMRVVERLIAKAHVDVEHGECVAGEPARLKGESAAFERPFGAILGRGHAAAC